jgi:hypothetical protein
VRSRIDFRILAQKQRKKSCRQNGGNLAVLAAGCVMRSGSERRNHNNIFCGKPATKTAANRRRISIAVLAWSERKRLVFSFLLILDEGGLREGWVKSAYSSLAAAES